MESNDQYGPEGTRYMEVSRRSVLIGQNESVNTEVILNFNEKQEFTLHFLFTTVAVWGKKSATFFCRFLQ